MTDLHRQPKSSTLWGIAIIAVAIVVAMVATWRLPGLNLMAHDALMRARGTMSAPDEIAIVAIDEASIKRFGHFPWSRAVMAQAIDKISIARPKAVALSILFSDPTNDADDAALVTAVQRAGNIVVASQLIETPLRHAEWVNPLPALEQAAAGIGHGNILTDSDGVARALTLREADDEGAARWALAVETLRVGDGLKIDEVRDIPDAVQVGARQIPIETTSPTIHFDQPEGKTDQFRASRMTLDYVGPTGSLAVRTYSLADVVDGNIEPEYLRGKYVLIGATAAAMGDRVASPFVGYATADGNQHGSLMPGVEVLANALTTMLHSRFYRETPDWLAGLIAGFVAAMVLGGLQLAQGRHEWLKQSAVLAGVAGLILLISYLVFTRMLIMPPVVPSLISLMIVAPLALLLRSFRASASLDERIHELTQVSAKLSPLRLRELAKNVQSNWLPQGSEAKSQALATLQKNLLDRTQFIDRALHSVEDGLVIADPQGIIAYANPRAAQIFKVTENYLPGSNFFNRLNLAQTGKTAPDEVAVEQTATEILARLFEERTAVEREIVIGASPARYYILRIASVTEEQDRNHHAVPLGFVATLADITKQRELQQLQTDVMALVTHEMKTPLTAIQGMSELLIKFEPEADKRKIMNEAINEAAQRMKRMIDEYLDLTRLESGAHSLRLAFIRPEILIEQTLLLLDPLAAQRGITLTRSFSPDLPVIFADADLLSRAVTNLVGNAIKYSPPRTDITIVARQVVDDIQISISDQGYGIPPEHRTRIFEKFFRVPRAEDADTPGTGLGLAMVREIAELHGGSVIIKSETGVGSTFTIRLPIQAITELEPSS